MTRADFYDIKMGLWAIISFVTDGWVSVMAFVFVVLNLIFYWQEV